MRPMMGCGLVASAVLLLLALALAFTVIGLSVALPMATVAVLGILGFGVGYRLSGHRT